MHPDDETRALLAHLDAYARTHPHESYVMIARGASSALEELLSAEQKHLPISVAASPEIPSPDPSKPPRGAIAAQRAPRALERMRDAITTRAHAISLEARAFAATGVLALSGLIGLSYLPAPFPAPIVAPAPSIVYPQADEIETLRETAPPLPTPLTPRVQLPRAAEQTPIFLYHHIKEHEERYAISPQRLREQLDVLREQDYRLVTFDAYATGHARAPRQAVLTFDDSTIDQFRILSDGTIDPNCAVGVLEGYRRMYPQFEVTATFFVNLRTREGAPSFEQEGLAAYKLEYLARAGYEIGAHATAHQNYGKMSPHEIIRDIEEFLAQMDLLLPSYEVRSFAYPYGSLPSSEGQQVVEAYFPSTAHAWGGVARGGRHNVPRIEFGPTTQLAQYIPRDTNVYKETASRTAHGRSDPQLQTR